MQETCRVALNLPLAANRRNDAAVPQLTLGMLVAGRAGTVCYWLSEALEMCQQVVWRILSSAALVASLYAAYVVGDGSSSDASVLAAFTFVLVTATLWVLVEANAEGRRWFAIGASCGIAASLILMLIRDPGILAFNILGKYSQNEMGPVFYSGWGSAVLTAWLAMLCGLAGAALGILRSRRPGVPIGLVWFLMFAGFFWLRTLAAHERPDPDAVGRVTAEKWPGMTPHRLNFY